MVNIEHFFVPEVYLGPECNNKCLFCSVGDFNYSKKSISDIRKELQILKKVASNIKFTGGEITIRPDLLKIVSYAKNLGFINICIESNGRGFSDEKYTKKILNSGANEFFISIHGHNPKIHDKVTGVKGSFNETFKGIKNLIKYHKYGVGINVVITNFNYRYLPDITGFLFGLGVHHVTLSFVTVCGSTMVNKKIVPRISDVIPFIKKTLDGYGNMGIGIGHIPLCFLKGYEKYTNFIRIPVKTKIVNPNFTITIESNLDSTLKKGKDCKKCRFYKICPGLWMEYVKLYGFSELKYVLGKKLKTPEGFKKEFG